MYYADETFVHLGKKKTDFLYSWLLQLKITLHEQLQLML